MHYWLLVVNSKSGADDQAKVMCRSCVMTCLYDRYGYHIKIEL